MPDASPPLTAEQRAIRARAAAYASWAKTPDRSARTAPARRAMLERFEREIDPDGALDPAVRAKRVEAAMRAHLLRMGLRASRARSKAAARRRSMPDPALADAVAEAEGEAAEATGGAA